MARVAREGSAEGEKSVKHLQPVPQPTEPSESQASSCSECRKLKRLNGQLRRELLMACANYLRAKIGAQTQRERLHRAIVRESHHIDQRAANTDRPTRERLTNGAPASREE